VKDKYRAFIRKELLTQLLTEGFIAFASKTVKMAVMSLFRGTNARRIIPKLVEV